MSNKYQQVKDENNSNNNNNNNNSSQANDYDYSAHPPHKNGGRAVPVDDGCVCCCCFDSGPNQNDPYAEGSRNFRTTMCGAPCADPCCFLGALFCPPCAQCFLRYKVLNRDMNRYTCCQGYFDECWKCCCCKDGLGEHNCPHFCLCLESTCCIGLAVSASRMYVMDQLDLSSDPCDRRLIVFNNCMQCLACICSLAAMISGDENIQEAARCIRLISDIVFLCISSCMTAQTNFELNETEREARERNEGPNRQDMK